MHINHASQKKDMAEHESNQALVHSDVVRMVFTTYHKQQGREADTRLRVYILRQRLSNALKLYLRVFISLPI
jgi:hypothetical protein